MANIKKYFKLDKTSRAFTGLNPTEQILVEEGHKIVCSYLANRAERDSQKSFADILNEMNVGTDERSRNEKFIEKMAKYCATFSGLDTTEFKLGDVAGMQKNTAFKEKFNAILAQILTPVIPAMVSAEFMDMADIVNIGWGETAKFKIRSNDSYFVTRIAEGVLDGSVQRVYNDEVTVNPQPLNIKTTVDWYQVAAGVFDIGEFVYRIGISFSSYITNVVIKTMLDYIDKMPTAYVVDGFSTITFARLAEIVRAANNAVNVRAYGPLTALMSVLPGLGASTVVANLQLGLGKEWTELGYLGRYMGVDMHRIPQIVLPNTVNSNPALAIPADMIFMFADGGYRPVKIVFEGTAVSIDIIPTESSDKEMGVQITMRMGASLIAASKFGVIKNIVPPTGA